MRNHLANVGTQSVAEGLVHGFVTGATLVVTGALLVVTRSY